MIATPALLPGVFRSGYTIKPFVKVFFTTDITTLEGSIQAALDALHASTSHWYSEPVFVALGSVGAQRVNVLMSYVEFVRNVV